jgi:GTPase SAR1 family protein
VQVEFIDTPGLDEIEGEQRAKMAREVARQSDLILFVVAGDITRTEYQALKELQRSQKPLILVFNKIDLYPERDREAIYQQLQKLQGTEGEGLFSQEQIVTIAADPQPMPVRIEWSDGRVTKEWEAPPPQIGQLQEKILDILNQEGRTLLALNSLIQGREAQENIAKKTIEIRKKEAEELIWKYAQYKALAVAANPIAIFDVLGGIITDLALIRALARLYGLPITSYEAGKLWKTIITSTGGLIVGQIIGSLMMGLGKTGSMAISPLENPLAFTSYATVALAQGTIAGYGAYTVGKAAQMYLEKGCTWGPLGANTVIQDILRQAEPESFRG